MATSRFAFAVAALFLFSGCSSGGGGGGCFPSCAGRMCGDNGCGGSCGTCGQGTSCNNAGVCVTGCTPDCSGGRNCGNDGCGGSCGTCSQGYACTNAGMCAPGCSPSCNGKQCGDNGCGGSCGTCGNGFACTTSGTCAVDPTSLWVITVTDGTVSQYDPNGQTWDAAGGAPDPFVCLTINNVRNCTSTQQDTFTPLWNESFPAATANAMMNGVIVEIWDEDISANDPICSSGTVPVSDQNFAAGTWGASCQYGGFSATLTPQ